MTNKNRIGSEYNKHCIISGNPTIGKNTWVGYFTILDGTGGLTIGENCSIASGVHIYTHDAIKWAILGLEKNKKTGEHLNRSNTIIGDNVFIGANAIILKGVTIGKQSIVAAGSIVHKDIPPNSIVAGNPAQVIGKTIITKENELVREYFSKRN